jgi:aryl-alcohol dehydrogenase-like predicted oxidoreductase
MEYMRLGDTGLTVSRICLGCMSYGDPAASLPGAPRVAGLETPYVPHSVAGF